MKRKSVLVTGVAGFIGSNLAARLLRDGYEVTGIDDLSQGLMSNLAGFRDHSRFHFVRGDVTKLPALKRAWRSPDAVIHLAAYKIPRYGNALKTLQVNVHGSENILKLAMAKKVKVLIASTSDVYGKNEKLPFSEEHNLVLGPSTVQRWAYAASKILDEHLALAYAHEAGLPVVLMRFFGSYGPHQNLTWWGGPQSVFIAAALNDQPITIHGDGKQTRSFTYIDDTVEGIVRCLESKKANGEIMNIGNRREISIKGLAEMIWKMVRPHGKPKLTFIPYSTFGKYEDVRRRVPDITKSKRLLGFEAKVQLEVGLPRTIEWQVSVMRNRTRSARG